MDSRLPLPRPEAASTRGDAERRELLKFAGHVDLYDRVNLIPWDKLASFFQQHLGQGAA
jgi:fermentation-respiration switch protein FrsA (DUF1100 family)